MPRCKVCREKFEAKYFLQKACFNPACLAEWAKQDREKKENDRFKAKKKEFNLNDVKYQHSLTQPVFNRLRVKEEIEWFKSRGIEPVCISCSKPNMDWCCGHFKTRGAQGNLRYDRKNTFLQCNRYCNMGLSGNIYGNKNTRGYIQGLKDRFGESGAQEIIDYCESETGPKKFTGKELEQMRKEFNIELKKLL